MKLTLAELMQHSGNLFAKQAMMLPLWQTLAENFYPERADFTLTRNIGQELAIDLIDSYPILARRDMANSLHAMLRDGDWVSMTTDSEPDYDARTWLEWGTRRMLKLFKTRDSNFVRATKEGDHDYVTFGQNVLSVELNKLRTGLLVRCWHLKDCAWFEDETGNVCGMYRKQQMDNWQVKSLYADKVHPTLERASRDTPFDKTNVLYACIPTSMYGDAKLEERFKYVRLCIDTDRQHIMEELGTNVFPYVVPRFQTIAGSQYAYSPATVVALPDARLIQAMTHTLLEAGERYVRPPIVATSTVVRGDVDLSPDGITWVDKEYDEKMGAALRPLFQDRGGFPIGHEMRAEIKEVLASAFYLNKLSMPPIERDMTAYEVSERMKQYRRECLPLFAPIESDYNGQLCEISFALMFQNGLLGSPYDVPRSLQGREVIFKFNSPLNAAEEEKKATRFQQVRQMLAETVQLAPSVADEIDMNLAFRDAVEGIGSPEKWLNDPRAVLAQRKQRMAAQQMQAAAMAMGGKPAAQSAAMMTAR